MYCRCRYSMPRARFITDGLIIAMHAPCARVRAQGQHMSTRALIRLPSCHVQQHARMCVPSADSRMTCSFTPEMFLLVCNRQRVYWIIQSLLSARLSTCVRYLLDGGDSVFAVCRNWYPHHVKSNSFNAPHGWRAGSHACTALGPCRSCRISDFPWRVPPNGNVDSPEYPRGCCTLDMWSLC